MGELGQRDPIGNTQLVEHGIQTEDSDYRIHVCFSGGVAYLFPTQAGREAVEAELGHPFAASQRGVNFVTGKGRRIPANLIEECKEIEIPAHWLAKVDCRTDDNPAQKGKKAVTIAKWLLMRGKVPIPISTKDITEKQLQIKGKDLIVTSEWAIEVKCDYFGAEKGLALQTHECNPFGIH
jgi:hypothetical protein